MNPTRVVNIRTDHFDVYIGRAGKGQDGFFGNPFRLDQAAGSRSECLEAFRNYFLGRITMDPEFRRRVLELRGKTLGCFCAPPGGVTAADRPWCCHGQVISDYLDGLCGDLPEGR